MRPLFLACVVVPFAFVVACAADQPTELADRLGDRDFHVREAAGKQLDAFGETALPALKQIAATGSPEAVRRAQSLAQRIAARIENEKALAPKLVTLDLRDADFRTVADAIQKQTGYKLAIDDEVAPAKKVTIRLTKRPFWEAVAEVNRHFGLGVAGSNNVLTTEMQAGTVVLSPSANRQLPSHEANAVCVVTMPFEKVHHLDRTVIPLVLRLVPEPRFRLGAKPEIFVSSAVTADGRKAVFDPFDPHVIASNWGDADPGRHEVIRLQAPAGESVKVLKTVDGIVRAKLWTDERVTFNLTNPKKPAVATVANSGQATADLSAWESGGGWSLAFFVGYPKEASRAVRDSVRRMLGAPNFHLTNAAGEPFSLGEIQTDFFSGQIGAPAEAQELHLSARFFTTKTKPGQSPPVKLVWTAPGREKEVEVPFKFTDVPVTPGTRDPNAKPTPPELLPERIHGGIGP